MSTTVDERIVSMQFDNKNFESNVQTSLGTLDKLKNSLNLQDSAKGLTQIDAAAKGISFDGLSNGVETVKMKFSALEVMAVTALANITNSALNAGKRIALALTIDPIKSGFQEYETQINAVQTILANTESKGSTLKDVNAALNELNTYADKTIYNFTEMTRNIGAFTAAGVDLNTSVQAIKGIANLAAVSGSNAQQASTAMYQLSQALASGTVKLQDWNSVVNAGMGGQVFQDALKETARVHGIKIDEMIKKQGSFRETLSKGSWLTSEILTETLNKFTGDMSAEQLKAKGYSDQQVKEILKLGQTANDAATKVKTFSQLWDTLKEAVQSGWTQSWQTVIGDFEDAKATLTEFSTILGNLVQISANTRNAFLKGWADLGGRAVLIDVIKNSFNSLASVIIPVKEAFREIFPATTSQQLYNMTKALSTFTKNIQLNKGEMDNLKNTFKGLFAVLDIGVQLFSAIVKAIFPIAGSMSGIVDQIFSLTGWFGKYLVSVDEIIKKTNVFGNVMQTVVGVVTSGMSKITDVLTITVNGIKTFASFLQEKFSIPGLEVVYAFFSRLITRIQNVISVSGNLKDAMDDAFLAFSQSAQFAIVTKSFEGFITVLKTLWKVVVAVGNVVGDTFSKIATSMVKALSNGDFNSIFDLLNSGTLLTIGAGIIKFVKGLNKGLASVGNILGGVKKILDGVRGCLEAYQQKIKAGVLTKIAVAIGILAASILTISLIDSKKLTQSLGAITVMFVELMGAMAVLNKLGGDSKKASKSVTSMIGMSVAVLALATAMKKLADIDPAGIAKGLISIAVLMATMVAAAKIMSDNQVKAIKGAAGLVIFAAAIKVLASACKDLSTLSWEQMIKGLLGVGTLLAEVALFLNTASFSLKTTSTATGILILSAAIKVLASACEDFSKLSWGEIGKGLASVGALLAELALFTNLTGNAKHVVSTGTALVLIAASMKIFASALSDFGKMEWDNIGRGLTAMGGALTEVAVAINLMPKNMVGIGTGLVIVGAALNILAIALGAMGGMSFTEIGKGLLAMGVALGELTIALNLMKGTLAGSAALLVATGAIALLVPSLMLLSTISWEGLIKGFTALAGSFAILGVAGVVLGPLTPVILALAGAFTLMGVGVVALGAGLLLVGTGLTALATGIGALGAMGAAGAVAMVASLTVIITGVAALIPMVIGKIGEGLIQFAQAIIAGAPVIVQAAIVILQSVVAAITQSAPLITNGILQLLVSLLQMIVQYTPTIVQAAFNILLAILQGIANNLPRVIQAGVNIVVAFLTGVGNAIPQVVDAGFKMIIEFINGIANSIRTNTPLLVSAMNNLMNAMLDAGLQIITGGHTKFFDAGVNLLKGFVNGIKNTVGEVSGAVESVVKTAVATAKEKLQIHSPSKVFTKIGEYTGEGYANGIKNTKSTVSKAANDLGDEAINTMLHKVTEGGEKINAAQKKSDTDSLNEKKDFWTQYLNANQNGVNAQSTVEKNMQDEEDKNLEKDKTRKKASVKAEDQYWKDLLKVYQAGADAKKYKNVKIEDFEKDILEQTTAALKEYNDELVRNTQSLMGNSSIFEAVQSQEAVSVDTLTKNLKSQVDQMASFNNTVASLNTRIKDDKLKDAINQMGVDSLSQLQTLNSMTDTQLDAYVKLYDQKYALCQNVASIQLTDLQTTTESKLSGLYGGAAVQLNKFVSSFDGSFASINKYVQNAINTGGQIANGVAQGMTTGTENVKTAAGQMINSTVQTAKEVAQIHSPSQLFANEVGSYIGQGVGIGISDPLALQVVYNGVTTLINSALNAMRSLTWQFYGVGENCAYGFESGILSKSDEIASVAASVVESALDAAKSALDIHSPSRKFKQLGMYSDMGFALGLKAYSGTVEDASASVGKSAISSISNTLSNLSTMVTDNVDTQPTIRPVLDLSLVSSGVKKLNSIVSGNKALAVDAEVGESNLSLTGGQNGVTSTGGKTISFVQNNYSPKALSRLEIYRQTKNQISVAKGALGT